MRRYTSLPCLIALVGIAPPAGASELSAEELKSVVHGKTWALTYTTDRELKNPTNVAYWDFRANGTVCARFPNAKPKTPCADEGKWRLEGQRLCWDLARIGETYGYKSRCVQVRKLDAKRFEAFSGDGKLPIVFYPMK